MMGSGSLINLWWKKDKNDEECVDFEASIECIIIGTKWTSSFPNKRSCQRSRYARKLLVRIHLSLALLYSLFYVSGLLSVALFGTENAFGFDGVECAIGTMNIQGNFLALL